MPQYCESRLSIRQRSVQRPFDVQPTLFESIPKILPSEAAEVIVPCTPILGVQFHYAEEAFWFRSPVGRSWITPCG